MERITNYGLPYMGSKNAIAEWVVRHMPKATNLYDLFAGGCAITHRAMLVHRFQNIYANDIVDTPILFADAIKGNFKDEKRWISRDDFNELKESDIYVRVCWSFGNNQSGYLYSKDIEPWRRALHYARVFGDFSLLQEMGIDTDGSREDICNNQAKYKEQYIRWYLKSVVLSDEEYKQVEHIFTEDIQRTDEELRDYLLEALRKSGLTQSEVQRRLGTQMSGHYFGRSQWAFPTREYYNMMREFMPLPLQYDEIYGLQQLRKDIDSLERLVNLERLERLQTLANIGKANSLTVTQGDYQDVEIKPDSVIYCDIPYRGTAEYLHSFDYDRFYQWCRTQTTPVLISEYSMPDDFVLVAECKHRATLSSTSNTEVIERLFTPAHQAHLFKKEEQLTLF